MNDIGEMGNSVEDWLQTYTDLDHYISACSSEEQLLELARRMAEDAAQSGVVIDSEEVFSALLLSVKNNDKGIPPNESELKQRCA